MNFTVSLLLDALSDLESRFDDEAIIAQGVGEAFLLLVFGIDWFTKHIQPSATPDPWMLNPNNSWLASHRARLPEGWPLIHGTRITRLGDALFTVIPKLQEGEELRQRFLKRNDTRASFIETEVASLLIYNGCSVRVVGESGARGQDFDLAATVRGVSVTVEVTAITKGPMTINTVLNKLHGKRDQVPADRPAVLYIHIPENWMRNRSLAFLILDTAIRRFFRKSRRYNTVVFLWEWVRIAPDGNKAHMSVQPVYNNHPRFRIPDYTVFSLKRNQWGMQRVSRSLLEALRTLRMSQHAEAALT
jgi:hypothetical protein